MNALQQIALKRSESIFHGIMNESSPLDRIDFRSLCVHGSDISLLPMIGFEFL